MAERKKDIPGKDHIGLGVGAVILNGKNEILLMKRNKKIASHRTTAGLWSIPGGEVEFGERVEDAVKRETMEELGIEITIQKPIGHWDQILPKSKVHWHCVTFLCKMKKGTLKILEPEKFDQIKWFPLNRIPKDAGVAHVAVPLFLLGYMSKKEFSRRLRETPES